MNKTAGLTLHLKSQKKCPDYGVHLIQLFESPCLKDIPKWILRSHGIGRVQGMSRDKLSAW